MIHYSITPEAIAELKTIARELSQLSEAGPIHPEILWSLAHDISSIAANVVTEATIKPDLYVRDISDPATPCAEGCAVCAEWNDRFAHARPDLAQ